MNNGKFGVFKRECVDMFCVLKTNQIMQEIESLHRVNDNFVLSSAPRFDLTFKMNMIYCISESIIFAYLISQY